MSLSATYTCPVCGLPSRGYAPWYKPSKGTLGGHLYTAHTDELLSRMGDPSDGVMAKVRAAGFRVERGRPGRLPIKIVSEQAKRR